MTSENRLKSFFKSLPEQRDAAPYRIAGTIPLGVTTVGSLLLIYIGPSLHRGFGTPDSSVYVSAWQDALLSFVPIGMLLVVWFSHAGWKELEQDRIFVWQAYLTLILAYGLAIIALWDLVSILVFGDFADKDVNGDALLNVSKALPTRLSDHFRVFSVFWSIILLLGLYQSKAQEQKHAKKDEPET